MAELDILPAWATHYLTENILDHARVLNALPIQDGHNTFLLNTSRGALMLSKKRFGEPRHWMLPLPGTRVDFDCDMCSERMGFINPEVPRLVHCPHCAAEYTLVEDGGDLFLLPSEPVLEEESAININPTNGSSAYVDLASYDEEEGKVPEEAPIEQPEPQPEPKPEPQPEPWDEPEPEHTEVIANKPNYLHGTISKGKEVPSRPGVREQARSVDYRDYDGDIHQVIDIEGIGPVYAENLRRIGVRTTARLCYENPEQLANRIGARQKTVESWQAMAQLMKIKGVGPQYAEVLVRAGIQMDGLRRRSPDRIAEQVNAYQDSLETNVLGHRITGKRVTRWQEAAKAMRRVKLPVPLE